jgi:hypothetical protein
MEALDSSETLIPICHTMKVNYSASQRTIFMILMVVRTSNKISAFLSSGYRREQPDVAGRLELSVFGLILSYKKKGP